MSPKAPGSGIRRDKLEHVGQVGQTQDGVWQPSCALDVILNSIQMSQKRDFGAKNNVLDEKQSISNIQLKIRIQDGRQNPIWRLSILRNEFQ